MNSILRYRQTPVTFIQVSAHTYSVSIRLILGRLHLKIWRFLGSTRTKQTLYFYVSAIRNAPYNNGKYKKKHNNPTIHADEAEHILFVISFYETLIYGLDQNSNLSNCVFEFFISKGHIGPVLFPSSTMSN